MSQELDNCEICYKMVYDDSFMRLDSEENESFYYHKECWIQPKDDKEKIIDFLNEVEEQDRILDADDIRHILKMDFDYVRKQYKLTNTIERDSK